MDSVILELYLNGRYRKNFDNNETCFIKEAKEYEKRLNFLLDEDGKKLLNKYRLSIVDHKDYVIRQTSIELLNLGIKIGMQLQDFFMQNEECWQVK